MDEIARYGKFIHFRVRVSLYHCEPLQDPPVKVDLTFLLGEFREFLVTKEWDYTPQYKNLNQFNVNAAH